MDSLKLPTKNIKNIKDQETLENLKGLLKINAKNVIQRTILKNYINIEDIDKLFDEYIHNIEISDISFTPITINYKNLCLNHIFTSDVIKNINNLNTTLHEYPDFINLLEITGLTCICSNEIFNHNEIQFEMIQKKSQIKTLIANYFATSHNNLQMITTGHNHNFSSYGKINPFQLNIIYTLSNIVGEDCLAETLISQEPENFLKTKIDEITNYPGLGETFLTNLNKLNHAYEKYRLKYLAFKKDEKFINEKINPLKIELKEKIPRYQIFITIFLENNNYNIENFNNCYPQYKINLNNYKPEDIKIINDFITRFDNTEDFIQGGIHDTPPVIKDNSRISIHKKDFSFINKIYSEHFNDEKKLLSNKAILMHNKDATVSLLVEEIIPRALKNKNIHIDINELIHSLLIVFDGISYIYNNEDKNAKKIEKIQKNKLKK